MLPDDCREKKLDQSERQANGQKATLQGNKLFNYSKFQIRQFVRSKFKLH